MKKQSWFAVLAFILLLVRFSAEYFKSPISGIGEQSRDNGAPIFHGSDNPKNLSDWGIVSIKAGELVLSQSVIPYTLKAPLFTDYAHKLRTIWVPEGQVATLQKSDALNFPTGTVISKTFYYPRANPVHASQNNVLKVRDRQMVNHKTGLKLTEHRLLETRLLVHREAGWEALSYIWNEAQTNATLTRIGGVIPLSLIDENLEEQKFSYIIPNINQCAGCHAPNATSKELVPLGPRTIQLDTVYGYEDGFKNQLMKFQEVGFFDSKGEHNGLDALTMARYDDESVSLDIRARGYLDSNCAHCHNPVGPADTSGLHLNIENTSLTHLGVCKNAIAAGAGTGGRLYDIDPGSSENSILHYRMIITDPGARMPELGRSLVHKEGAELVAAWIDKMENECR